MLDPDAIDPGSTEARYPHRLPKRLAWCIHIGTAIGLVGLNLITIGTIKICVRWKFRMMEIAIAYGNIYWGIVVLIVISMFFAFLCLGVIFQFAPAAAGSGSPENKGWLNGSQETARIFTTKNMIVRAIATIFSNTSGFPVGREGPTVTMGSNLAFVVTEFVSFNYVKTRLETLTAGGASISPSRIAAMMVDSEAFRTAKRNACAVGGACGMTMIFDSPIGGIVYMFEEIGAISWGADVTFSAFGATIVCDTLLRLMLEVLTDTDIKNFVIFKADLNVLGTGRQGWQWKDVPFFMIIALVLGPFSAAHTHICLWIASMRQKLFKRVPDRWQVKGKVLDGLLFAVFCSLLCTMFARLGGCRPVEEEDIEEDLEVVKFDCTENHYNPVASLLVTTSEAAMKLLFAKGGDFQVFDLLLAFTAYTTMNVCLTGIPVPSGNFTGTMLIGGFVGRAMGAAVNGFFPGQGYAAARVYAMMGSAAMLCGFKRMSMAVVLFIAECGDDWNLVPPLMLSVYTSLMLNRFFLKHGFDEEQMMRKGIPFLEPEPHVSLCGHFAMELVERPGVQLPEQAQLSELQAVLKESKLTIFPVVAKDTIVGFTSRVRLEAVVSALESISSTGACQPYHESRLGTTGSFGFDNIDRLLTESMVARSATYETAIGNEGGAQAENLVRMDRLVDPVPYTVNEAMPAPRVYALFAKAGVQCCAVIADSGNYRGMITRSGIANMAKKIRESSH